MARMRPVAQRVDDPDIEVGQRRDACRRQTAEVAGISELAEAKAERGQCSPWSCSTGRTAIAPALPRDGDRRAGDEPVLGHDRRIFAAGRRGEAIAEPATNDSSTVALVEVDVDAPSPLEEQRAQIVDAVGVVGMLVGVEHAVEPVDLGIDELLAQIRRGVDQYARHAAAPRRHRAARPEARCAGAGFSDFLDRNRPSRAPAAARRRRSRSREW